MIRQALQLAATGALALGMISCGSEERASPTVSADAPPCGTETDEGLAATYDNSFTTQGDLAIAHGAGNTLDWPDSDKAALVKQLVELAEGYESAKADYFQTSPGCHFAQRNFELRRYFRVDEDRSLTSPGYGGYTLPDYDGLETLRSAAEINPAIGGDYALALDDSGRPDDALAAYKAYLARINEDVVSTEQRERYESQAQWLDLSVELDDATLAPSTESTFGSSRVRGTRVADLLADTLD